jgi:hypothetical protein
MLPINPPKPNPSILLRSDEVWSGKVRVVFPDKVGDFDIRQMQVPVM